MSPSWTLDITEDPNTGDGILILPPDLLEQAGWKEGDNLIWIDNHDGSWSLIKEDLTNFVIKGIINNEQN
jgi:bifunctional DNA-binding transcriptional regulator/antitoxin component of YhaV-PrlF toxin-antitoxin module